VSRRRCPPHDRQSQPDPALPIGRRGRGARPERAGSGAGGRTRIAVAAPLGARRFAVLARGPLRNDGVESASRGLLSHLSLLFIPAGVGVVQKLDLLADRGIAILFVLAVSVLVTLLVTVATFLVAGRWLSGKDEAS
jgi:hypothetical protein